MTTPAPQNPGIPTDPALAVDLSDMLDDLGSGEVSVHSFDAGISLGGGVVVGGGVEVSVSTEDGVPQVSIDAEGQFATEGQFEAYGSYDDIDLSTDAQTGTSDVSIESTDAAVSGGVQASGGFDFDLNVGPLEGGIPEIGLDVAGGFAADHGFDISFGHDHVEIHDAGGDNTM
ncbi:hypothetical protein [Rhodococcus spongiicola]|uniref:Uncharacterized protein n=1 Tax=Rhodococcus spongiicola TaxID=2487352 RepID=A0A438B0N3_9NOCA|nr:hypothetical protein [Rhodococcus spongiicola]RVW04448.1 hypothetical protein EF834_05025 [Rhodococcus spongiicola]